MRTLIFLAMNELNFDLVSEYVSRYPKYLPNFSNLLKLKKIKTFSEEVYEEIEPWIQWPSVHTGLSFAEHGMFRLGDSINSDNQQIFGVIERMGWSVGAVSPMNARNDLDDAAYFLPDPWSGAAPDGSFWSNLLSDAFTQTINDNSQSKITVRSAISILLAMVKFSNPRNYMNYASLAIDSFKQPWKKAIFFDLLLNDIHLSLFKKKCPNFTYIFLNAGAHIQHHYYFNSKVLKREKLISNPDWYISEKEDPIFDLLKIYDVIIGDYIYIDDAEIILATGLTQIPYDRIKYYYRLKDHKNFLRLLGVEFEDVFPRMTRDFLVKFSDLQSLQAGFEILRNIRVEKDNFALFGEIQVLEDSLFVVLNYPNQILDDTKFSINGISKKLKPHVSFVALKNGMHSPEGFAFFTPGIEKFAPREGGHVKFLFDTMLNYVRYQNDSSCVSNST